MGAIVAGAVAIGSAAAGGGATGAITSIGAYPAGPVAARVAMVAGAVSNSMPGRTTIVAVSIEGFSMDSIDGGSIVDVSIGGAAIAAGFAIFAAFAAGFFAFTFSTGAFAASTGAFAAGAGFTARGFAGGFDVGVVVFAGVAAFGFAAGGGTGALTGLAAFGSATSAASAFFSGALDAAGAGVVRRTSRGFRGSAVCGTADAGGADDELGERLSGCFALAMDLVPEVLFAG